MTGTIQTEIDALPATGAMVKLLDGTYNIATGLVLDSYQTLKGCGRNTIFTATTADLDIITATGGSGTEKVGILLADFCIDGNAGGETNDIGIMWTYVDDSKILNCWLLDNGEDGIYIAYSDHNIVTGNHGISNGIDGIYLESSSNNTISGNVCHDNVDYYGIELYLSSNNTVLGNTCQVNGRGGISLWSSSDNNTISDNTCQGNGNDGISLESSSDNNNISDNTCQGNDYGGIWLDDSSNNTIMGNALTENSQTTTNTYDDIQVEGDSDYNNIQGNTCRAGSLTNKPRYGINISDATCNENKVINNDLYNDGFGTGAYNDDGTGTIKVEPSDTVDAIAKKHTQLCEAADFTKLDGIEALADVTADHDPKAHAASQQFLGADPLDFTDWVKSNVVLFNETGAGFGIANLWTHAESAGMTFYQRLVGSAFISDATANRTGYLYTTSAAFVYDWFKWIILTTTGATDYLAWLWISNTAGASTPVAGQKYAGFKLLNGTIFSWSSDGAVEENQNTGVSIGTNNMAFMIHPTASAVYFYIDGVLKTTHETRVPGGVVVYLKCYMTNTSTVVKNLYMRSIAVRRA